MGCGVVERHLEMAQPTKKSFMPYISLNNLLYTISKNKYKLNSNNLSVL